MVAYVNVTQMRDKPDKLSSQFASRYHRQEEIHFPIAKRRTRTWDLYRFGGRCVKPLR